MVQKSDSIERIKILSPGAQGASGLPGTVVSSLSLDEDGHVLYDVLTHFGIDENGVPYWSDSPSSIPVEEQAIYDPVTNSILPAVGRSGDVAGADGLSAYQLATAQGFEGTVQEWLDSLVGPAGNPNLDVVNSTRIDTGTAQTIPDISAYTGSRYRATANCTLTLPTPGPGKHLQVEVEQDATGGRIVTWATPSGSVLYMNGAAPVASTGPGKKDLYTCQCDMAGINWIVALIIPDFR